MARSVVQVETAVPVGLFGLAMKITSGCCSSMAATASRRVDGEVVAARRRCVQAVWVLRAYSGYIEYVGANDSTVRPGPPKACSTCSITSLLPLAAHTWSAVRPWPR